MNNNKIGIFGENKAIDYLKKQNYIILKKNYKTYYGEIDIIAKKEDIIAFIEVKSRNSTSFGYPYEAVNKFKQQKIINTAQVYIKQYNLKGYQFRFDIIEILFSENKINHILNAFWL